MLSNSARSVPPSLWLVAFLQGAAVLVIEVLGARMLTPYFGTSHYVWTAQITITLLALTAGYALGARLASHARRRLVRWALVLAGAYTGVTPVIVASIAYASFRLPLPLGAMLTSVVLFALPLAALAAISPCLVAEASAGALRPGDAAGRVAAVSTGGSVVGVLIVAYACIPYLASSTTMYGLSLSLACAALLLGRDGRERLGELAAPLVVACLTCGAAYAEAHAGPAHTRHYDELERSYSAYSTLQVWRVRGANELSLSTNFTFQNDYDPSTRRSTDAFSYVLTELVRSYAPRAKSALIIGLGVGIVPRELQKLGIHSTVMELDPVVPALAAKYFDADLGAMDVRIGDGRRLLSELDQRYDLVILDAFHGDSTPSHLLSREAFAAMAGALTPGGLLLTNSWTDLERPDQLMPVVLRTLRDVFSHVRVFDARLGNYYAVASNAPLLPRDTFDPLRVPERQRAQVTATFAAAHDVAPSPGLILTDDYNPADTLAARYFEYVRRASAGLARPQ